MVSKKHVLTEDMRKLVEANMNLVPFTLQKYLTSIHMDIDEKYSAAYYGLCCAAEMYNRSSGIAFSTYAVKCIISHVRRQSVYNMRQKRYSEFAPLSLNKYYESIENGEYLYFIEDRSVNVESEVLNKILLEKVVDRCPILSELSRTGATEKSLAAKYGISKQRVHQKKKAEIELARKLLAKIGIDNAG